MPIFRYGKKGGVMAIFLLVFAVIPILLAIIYVPQMADQVPTKVNAAGEVLRWGSRYEMLVAPALCFLLSVATLGSAFKQANLQKDSKVMARLTYERFVRNGMVTAVVLNLANAYLLIMVMTGRGYGF